MADLNNIRTACASITDVKEAMKQGLENNNDVRHIREELMSSLSGADFINLPYEDKNRVFSRMAPKDGEFQPMDAETQKSLDIILEYPGAKDAINKALGTVIRAMRTNHIAKSRYFPEFKKEDEKWGAQNKFFEEFYGYNKETGMADISKLVLLLKGENIESSEKVSNYIDANYIDQLLQNKSLHPQSKKQIENIKNLLKKNPNNKLNKDRLTIKNGFVVIDGFALPVEVTEQKYADMAAENSKQLYPDATIALLNFTAELTGKTFDRGTLNNENLTDRSLSYKEFFEILNTDDNNAILQSLSTIMGKVNEYQYIPMGIDKDGYVIYAGLRPDSIRFYGDYRFDVSDCLVPSYIGG